MELVKGNIYIVKHSSGFIRARFEGPIVRPGYVSRFGNRISNTRTHYLFVNLGTGREIEVKSTVKIRRQVEDKA